MPSRSIRDHAGVLTCALLLLVMAAPAPAWADDRPSNADCLACHGDTTLTHEVGGKQVSLGVDEAKFKASIHSMFNCVDCHSDVTSAVHERTPQKPSCGACHADAELAYHRGVHALSLDRKKNGSAATCASCHGNVHEVLPSADPDSRTHHSRISETCGDCHKVKFVMEESGLSARPFFSYNESVHGKAVAAGSEKAATCTDCHRAHDVLTAREADSPILKFNIPETCGKCHQDVAREFNQSIHGQALARGNTGSAVCTDCHGIHMIKSHIDPTSSVAAQALARTTCARCHEGVRLSQEFGVSGRRASTYLDSYHGLAGRRGLATVANCASCHGVHNILPSRDPRSTIHRDNLVATCGSCHPGVGEKFALARVHFDVPLSADWGSIGTRWVRSFYLLLIPLVLGLMVLHNVIIWRRKAIQARDARPRPFVRMRLGDRIQHWLLLSSFILLALTGFALAYPESWFAWIMGTETIRRLLHRIAGAVLIGLGFYHLYYLVLTRNGRQDFWDFLPTRKDLRDFSQNMLYHLGRSRQRPRYGRFTYADKAEYLALVWGTALMGLTGVMMWFKTETSMLVPRWVIDVATALHFYEAVLAVSAIVIWHFYHVIFDPDVYPLNWAFWDGRISEEHLRHHHPLLYEQMAPSEPGEPPAQQAPEEAAEPGPAPSAGMEEKSP